MENREPDRGKGQKLALLAFEAIMAVLYLFFAIIFLFPTLFPFQFAQQFEGIRIALGIVLGIYGIFRIYRVVRKLL